VTALAGWGQTRYQGLCETDRNGVVLAPASCRLLADLILARPAILPAKPYALTARR